VVAESVGGLESARLVERAAKSARPGEHAVKSARPGEHAVKSAEGAEPEEDNVLYVYIMEQWRKLAQVTVEDANVGTIYKLEYAPGAWVKGVLVEKKKVTSYSHGAATEEEPPEAAEDLYQLTFRVRKDRTPSFIFPGSYRRLFPPRRLRLGGGRRKRKTRRTRGKKRRGRRTRRR
jgi:hypothetical protein